MIVGLVACCSKKEDKKTKAVDMYKSTLFTSSMKYLKKRCDKIYILSAKYGLVELDNEIDVYNVTLNKINSKNRLLWSNNVIVELRKKVDLEKDTFIILAGLKYREHIIKYIKSYNIPMSGLGIGKQLKFLKEDDKNE